MAQRFRSMVDPMEMVRVHWTEHGDALQQRVDQSQDEQTDKKNGQHMHDRKNQISGRFEEGTHELAHKPG
jgi:hypothetical protein